MSPVRMGVLISVSLAAAIGFALVARTLTAAHEPKPQIVVAGPAQKPMMRVLVAKHDLEPGDKLSQADFTWQPWPADALNPEFVTDGPVAPAVSEKAPTTVKIETAAMNAAKDRAHDILEGPGAGAKMIDAVVHEAILQGEPITDRKVVRSGAAGVLAATLDPGMRAMAVPLSAESAAGGFILPGDHVDVVQSRQLDAPGGIKKYAAGAVLTNVKVMAIDQSTRNQKTNAVIGATATLEVTPAQAELLALSKSQGDLTLILRSYADMSGQASAGAGPRLAQEADAPPTIVKIFRNGAPSEVAVAR